MRVPGSQVSPALHFGNIHSVNQCVKNLHVSCSAFQINTKELNKTFENEGGGELNWRYERDKRRLTLELHKKE